MNIRNIQPAVRHKNTPIWYTWSFSKRQFPVGDEVGGLPHPAEPIPLASQLTILTQEYSMNFKFLLALIKIIDWCTALYTNFQGFWN